MEQIKTKRLTMTLANLNDLPALEEIEKQCDEYFRFDPPSVAEHNRSLRECLIMGDIIPGVLEENYKRKNYYLYCIRKDDIIVGWLSFYLEYQQKDTAYISVMYIKESYRKSGIGVEIIEALIQKFISIQIKKVRLHISLRNAMAIRFWVKNGFNHIIDVECDGNLFPANFGGIELIRNI